MKFATFVDVFLVIITIHVLNLSDGCLGEEDIFKEIVHFHYMTYIATP